MGKTDWASVSLPHSLMGKLDESLKLDKVKELGVTSRAQIITLLLRKFLNNELNLLENKSETEIQNMQKMKKDIQKMMKDLQTEKNTVENMTDAMNKTILGENDEIDNLKINYSKNGDLLINDPSLKEIVKITNKNELPFCNYHNANFCYHLTFVSLKIMKIGMQEIKKKSNK